jgi:hypothetical protein
VVAAENISRNSWPPRDFTSFIIIAILAKTG